MNFTQALESDISNFTETQAVEAFNALFEEGDSKQLLNDAHEDFETAGSEQLPGVLVQSAQYAEDAENYDGADIFKRMLQLVRSFPDADFSC